MNTDQQEKLGFEVIEPEFNACFFPHEQVERLWSGGRWCEGPAWFPAHRLLVWSDVPNNRMLSFDERNNVTGIYRVPSNHANGNTVDQQGRLISCEHLGRRVIRQEHDGRLTVIADRWRGKRLNSPNDVVVAADGAIWFTDPDYGILSDYEGDKADSEIGGCQVYRADPITGHVDCVADDFSKPNGLAFSRDGKKLYVADTGASHDPDGPKHIRVFDVIDGGKRLGSSRIFAECTVGLFDGFRVDRNDRLWISAGDGIHVYNHNGALIGKLRLPETVANLQFGGIKGNILYICATRSLYCCRLAICG